MSRAVFSDPRLGVFCCTHIFRREHPVLLVVHDDNGDWQFLCGGSHDDDGPHYVHVGALFGADPTLHATADLPVDWEAERSDPTQKWIRTRSERDDA
jgi:hypothetical protein